MKEYPVSIRCFYPHCERYTRHFQMLNVEDLGKWVAAYAFTHPDVEAVSLKVYIQNKDKG